MTYPKRVIVSTSDAGSGSLLPQTRRPVRLAPTWCAGWVPVAVGPAGLEPATKGL